MIIFKTVIQLEAFIKKATNTGKTIGFVPTMGALHHGHISLIDASKRANSLTVCSIFVNPTQFNNPTDFEKYPVTIEQDIDKLEACGCDILFLPSVEEIYPASQEKLLYHLGYLETVLEGAYRPGHYQGVCQVVHRLLNIVQPATLYLGQKDYQQCMVIKKLVELTGIDTSIHIEKTIREKDGLAMSSRNTRLNPAERKKAAKIFEALSYVKNNLTAGSLEKNKEVATAILTDEGFKVDYLEVADAHSLQLLKVWDGKTSVVILTAAYLDEVRLIDNHVWG